MKKLGLLFMAILGFQLLTAQTTFSCDSFKTIISYDEDLCSGDSTVITVDISGGTGPYSYSYIYEYDSPIGWTDSSTSLNQLSFLETHIIGATFVIVVYDSLGCIYENREILLGNPDCDSIYPQCDSLRAMFTLSDSTFCEGDSVIINVWIEGSSGVSSVNGIGYNYNGHSPFLQYVGLAGLPYFSDTLVIVNNELITVTAISGYCIDKSYFTTVIDCDTTISVNEVLDQYKITFSPNPASVQLKLTWEVAQNNSKLDLINALGQTVKTVNLLQDNTLVEVSDLPEGLYFASVRNKNQVISTHKIVVQR